MLENDRIWAASAIEADKNSEESGIEPVFGKHCDLLLDKANRHGVIAGASGTGKTVTMKVLAEGFSQAGVPVFMADIKGDVAGIAVPGDPSQVDSRIKDLGADGWKPQGCPTRLWQMTGTAGIPVRITVSDMGPTLLSRLLGLTEVQSGVLSIVFRIADDKGMLLIDLKDLRALLNYVGENSKDFQLEYGRVSQQSVGAILRSLIEVEDQGGDLFFGEPAFDISDLLSLDEAGHGYVNILDATGLIHSARIYSMFLLWMLSELFETLPEVGDPDKPRLVFFFDEAHLLFDELPKALGDKIIQVVKLVRSKGVGIYFVSQSPSDIPDAVLAQLSNRIQHGLRAYTPAEQKAVRAAAKSFRENPSFDSEKALIELGTGEALVSFLNEKGEPSVVERALVLPPECSMDAPSISEIDQIVESESKLMEKYGTAIDRESAYEILNAEKAAQEEADALAAERAALQKEREELEKLRLQEQAKAEKALERERAAAEKERMAAEKAAAREAAKAEKEAERRQQQFEKTVNSVIGQIGREAGRQIVRGIFGSLKR